MSWQVALSGRVGDLEIEVAFHSADQPVLLVGPNGAGKSSIIRALAGVRNGLDGKVKLGERVLSSTNPDLWVPSEHRRVGYVPQGGGLFDHLSVLDNVAFGCATGAAGRRRARQALQQVDAEALSSRRIPTLSGGERQRVALARALAIEPEGFLLDEPLSALDVGKRRATRAFVADLLRTHKRPTVIVTHDVRDLAALPGLVVVLEHGRIVQQGDLATLREHPATEFVAELVMP